MGSARGNAPSSTCTINVLVNEVLDVLQKLPQEGCVKVTAWPSRPGGDLIASRAGRQATGRAGTGSQVRQAGQWARRII